MGLLDEEIGEAEEGLEKGCLGGVGVGRREAEGKGDALLWEEFVESVVLSASLSFTRRTGRNAHFFGWSIGISVITSASKLSPAISTALIISGVNSVSVISLASLITVAHAGNLA